MPDLAGHEGGGGHGRQPPNPPLPSLAVFRFWYRICQPCWFIPSQPPHGMRCALLLILDLEVLQQRLVLVLGGKAGVREVAVDLPPFAGTAVVEEFELFGDDEASR